MVRTAIRLNTQKPACGANRLNEQSAFGGWPQAPRSRTQLGIFLPEGENSSFLEFPLRSQGVLLARTYGFWQEPCSIFFSDKEDQS